MSYVTNRFDNKVIEILQGGGVGLVPSDTIYGLSCRALDEPAVNKLHSLKDRQSRKPFIILIANTEMLDMLSISERAVALAKPYWPGALTLICSAPDSPKWLHKGTKSLAVRIPDNSELIDLLKTVGPLVSTSANIENYPPAKTAAEAQKTFGDKLDFYVDIGKLPGQASTLVRGIGGKLVIIRQGAVKIS